MSLFDELENETRVITQEFGKAGSALVRGLQSVTSKLPTALAAPLQLGLGVLTGAVSGFAAALRHATNEAASVANSMATMRANNGIGFKQGYELTTRNSLFGISAQRTGEIFGAPGMNPMHAGHRANAMNAANPYDPDAFMKMAAKYQQTASTGPIGRMEANRELDRTFNGNAPQEIRNIVNLPPELIKKQLDHGKQVQSQMGISPTMIGKFAQEIPLAIQRITFSFQQAWLKLASELAPFIESTLGGIATYIGKNSGKIAEAIKKGVRFLVEDLPPLLYTVAEGILRGASYLLSGFSMLTAGIANNVIPILTVFDSIINGVQTFYEGLKGVYGFLEGLGVPQFVQGVGQRLTGNENKTGGEKLTNQVVGGAAVLIVLRGILALLAARLGRGASARTECCCCEGGGDGGDDSEGKKKKGGKGGKGGKKSFSQRLRSVRANVMRRIPASIRAPIARLGRAIPGLLKSVPGLLKSVPSLISGASLGGVSAKGLLSAAKAPVLLAGAAVGVAGYEGLRRSGLSYYKDMPSTYQILKEYGVFGKPAPPPAPSGAQGVSPKQAKPKSSTTGVSPAQSTTWMPVPPLVPIVPGQAGADPASQGIVPAIAPTAKGQVDPKKWSNLANDPILINNIHRLSLGASKSTADGAQKLWNLADGAKGMREGHPAVVAAIDKLTATTEKNGDKIVNAVNNGNSGDSGRVLGALRNSMGRDAYLAATR